MEQREYRKHKFLMQGSILALAGIIVRLIGLFYRIPMISIIGTKGNGYYTSAYSVYSLFLILSSYSFSAAISKIVSERLAEGRFKDVKNIIKSSFVLAFFVGIIMFSIMFFGADLISLIHRKRLLKFALRALAPTLFIMSFLGIFRGIFQGMGNMIPTAISQIFEQIANAVSSLVFAYILFNRGKIANLIYESEEYTYALGAEGGAIGTGVGAFTALVILFFMFLSKLLKNVFKSKLVDFSLDSFLIGILNMISSDKASYSIFSALFFINSIIFLLSQSSSLVTFKLMNLPYFSIKNKGEPIHFIFPRLIIPILLPKTLASSI